MKRVTPQARSRCTRQEFGNRKRIRKAQICLVLLNSCLRGYHALKTRNVNDRLLASKAIQIPACGKRHCQIQKAKLLAARRNFRPCFAQSRMMNGRGHGSAGTQTTPFSLGYGKEGAEVFTTLSFAKDWHKTIRNPQRAFSVRLPSTPTQR